jgi:hypothetical protein
MSDAYAKSGMRSKSTVTQSDRSEPRTRDTRYTFKKSAAEWNMFSPSSSRAIK